MTSSQKVFVALVAVAVVQSIVYYPQLPDQVASHFGSNGQPNGWSSKTVFIIIDLATVALMTLVFLFLPKSLSRFSDSAISLPNKDYWLAPERREKTYVMIQDQMCWFGAATLVFLIGVFQLVIEANLNPPATLSSGFMFLLIAYLAYTGWWVVMLISKFARVPK